MTFFLNSFSFISSKHRARAWKKEREKKIRKATINHIFLTISSFCVIQFFSPSKNSFFDASTQTDFCRKRTVEKKNAHGPWWATTNISSYLHSYYKMSVQMWGAKRRQNLIHVYSHVTFHCFSPSQKNHSNMKSLW